jgi:hypothetical protein
MPRDSRDVANALVAKGSHERPGDHKFYHLYVAGAKTRIWTKISHGNREIHDGLLCTMARQLRLTNRQFRDLVECPLTAEGFARLLRERGEVE